MKVVHSSASMFQGIGGHSGVWGGITKGKCGGSNVGKGMDHFMESVAEMSQAAMSNVGNIFVNNKRKVPRTEVTDNIQARPSSDDPPFSHDQRDWLGEVVGDSIKDALTCFVTGFARRIEARFDIAEKRLDQLEQQGEATAQTFCDLEQMIVDLRGELQKQLEASKVSTNVALHRKLKRWRRNSLSSGPLSNRRNARRLPPQAGAQLGLVMRRTKP